MVPYVVPPAVTALLWVYMFDGNFGVANDLLVRLGMLEHYVPWLSDPTGELLRSSAAAMVWAGQPLMADRPPRRAPDAFPSELYEASSVDGANAWQRFRYVTLPHLIPTILFLAPRCAPSGCRTTST